MIKTLKTGLVSTLLFLISINSIYAENEKFITIVNPVRISKYNKEPVKSLLTQYDIINKNNLSATWLLTYDVLDNPTMIDSFKKFNNNQELGIFLEISENFSKDIEVTYNNSGNWHHANSVFLSGYSQQTREKYIDKVFSKFKQEFGYYPLSIGSWWTDAYSLNYIKIKYGVVANLVCSDQFSTDNYQIWGQPWSIPYLLGKNHPAIPASYNDQLGIVNLQWAARDPLNGYYNSLYSTQDYRVTNENLDTNYFKKLVDFYLSVGDLPQIVVGLESDLDPQSYNAEFLKQIEYVKLKSVQGVKVTKMSDFAKKFLELKPSSVYKFEAKDFLGSGRTAVWYGNYKYRIHYVVESDLSLIIKDIRVYNRKQIDPYTISANGSKNLHINIPAIIDSITNPDDKIVLPSNSKIETDEDKIILIGKNIKLPKRIYEYDDILDVKKSKNKIIIEFKDNNEYFGNKNIKGFGLETLFLFKSKKELVKLILSGNWDKFKKIEYIVPQGEVDGLRYLKSKEYGKILVFDSYCLQCKYSTILRPIFMTNQRKYVSKMSDKPIIYSKIFFSDLTRDEAKGFLRKKGIKYIYLAKFEGYEETLMFSPGDYGIKKIFENENSTIWEVNDS